MTFYLFVLFVYTGIEWQTIKFLNLHVPRGFIIIAIIGTWNQTIFLNCYHERNNPFDRLIIKFCKAGKEETIGHIPMEISRVTKYFMDRGATVTAQLTGFITEDHL